MINGGTVTAAGAGTNSAGIYSSNNGVTITGGTVIATGTGDNSAGVEAYNNIVTIGGGKVTATGNYVAIKGNVKNAIAGTGWTNTEGTVGKADIPINTIDEGQELEGYKKVQFPAKVDPKPTPTPTPTPASVITLPTANDLTYNGQAQELVTAGSAEGGTMQYALGENGDKAPQSGWSAAVPTGTDVGTYYVWYKAKGDDPYGDSLPVCVTVKISEKSAPAPSVTSVTINSKTVSAKTLNAAIAKAGVNPDSVSTVVLGKKVKKIKKGAFKNFRNADTLVVKSKKLTRARVKGSLKGSTIKKVKVQVGKKKTNKKYVKRYKKIFKKKNCGKKVSVSR